LPIHDQTTQRQTLTVPAQSLKIPPLLDACRASKLQAPWSLRGHAGLESDRSQPFATHPASIAENSAAALARIAIQEAMLPFAAYFGRLILSFHNSSVSALRGHVSKVPPGQETLRYRNAREYQGSRGCQAAENPFSEVLGRLRLAVR